MTVPRVPTDSVALPSGARMPLLGFGTWQIQGEDAVRATAAALHSGYRHLDTATVYGNEGEVGRALAASGVPREQVFVTTKVPPREAGRAGQVLRESLDLLGLDRVDLWLVHWPEGSAMESLWDELLAAREAGLATDVGVSNYDLGQLDALHRSSGELPAVNQIEWSPLLFDAAVLDGHRERGVALEGYSALRGGTLEHPEVLRIARAHGATPAQVLVRWHLQTQVVVIPKSVDPQRIASNADVGELALSAQEVAALSALAPGRA